jgi:hypothetical protein
MKKKSVNNKKRINTLRGLKSKLFSKDDLKELGLVLGNLDYIKSLMKSKNEEKEWINDMILY